MEWKDVKSILLFSKTSLLFVKQANLKKTCVKVLSEELLLPIDEKDVAVKNKVLHVTAHPAVKNSIKIKKESLLTILREKTENQVQDIK